MSLKKNNKVKVLYIVSSLKRSGPTNQLSYIIKYLDKNKFEPIILTLSPEPNNDSMKPYFEESPNLRIQTLGLSRIKGVFFAKQKIRRFIINNNIDIVHSQGIRADSFVADIKIEKVVTLRNYPFYDYLLKFGKIKGMLMAQKHLFTIKKEPAKNIACAKTISKEFEKNGLVLDYIQNGVNTEKFFPLSIGEKKSLRKKLNINLSKKVFVSVGNLIERKDMSTVINAFNTCNHNDKLLLVLGDGVQRDNLERIAGENVIFKGNVSNVVEYLQASDYFVSASLAEGLPNTVLEAMACGLPTILSDIPSHRELYEGETLKLFFDVKSVEKLLKLFDEVSINQEDYYSSLSLKIIKNNFDAKLMSKKYQELYLKKISDNFTKELSL